MTRTQTITHAIQSVAVVICCAFRRSQVAAMMPRCFSVGVKIHYCYKRHSLKRFVRTTVATSHN